MGSLTYWGRDDIDSILQDIFKCIFFNENALILSKISLKFIPKGPINNIAALVQKMAWRQPSDISIIQPQWVNSHGKCRWTHS